MVYAKRGNIIRIIYLMVSLCIWALTLGGRTFYNKKIILCYHGIKNEQVDAFKKQVHFIKERCIPINNTITINSYLSKPKVLLTFDDAFENLLDNCLPIINEYNVPISIFVVTNNFGMLPLWLKDSCHADEKDMLMTESQIKEIDKNNLISIGAHTHNHKMLTSLTLQDAEEEINLSLNRLKKLCNRNIDTLAFPHGKYDKRIRDTAYKLGLNKVFTLEEKMENINKQKGTFGRFLMDPDVWPIEFYLTVNGSYSWLYMFRNVMKKLLFK